MTSVHKTQRALRSYTEGLQSQDLTRLFSRDAARAYSVLTRGRDRADDGGLFSRIRELFLGISYHLGPARRVLFCATLVLTFLALLDLDFRIVGNLPAVDSNPLFYLLAIAGLVFLLALELVDRVRVRDELEIARQLQRELLPEAAPPTAGYAFAQSYRTAQEIGGDYYDFLPTGDGRLAIVAGDASGHGIAAGILMVIASSTLKLAVGIDPAPERVVSLLNRALNGTGGSRAFMTLFYGLLDPASGELEYVCAGHPFPLVRRPGGQVEELGNGSLPLGLKNPMTFQSGRVQLDPGDLLLVYSDGFPESVRGENDEAFGFERMRALFRQGGSPQDVHQRIVQSHLTFLGGDDPLDDVSLVVMGRIPKN